MYSSFFKHAIDFFISLLLLVLAIPLFLLIALLIKVNDPGPIFFRQERIGRDGAPFCFYKFRTMPVGTANVSSDQLGDIQLSFSGKVLRRTNFDELPQLLNIFRGEMSIVGPRPPIPNQDDLLELRRSSGALACRPGLTGLAQVNSYEGMSVAEKAHFDAVYARQISFSADLIIIFRTVLYLLKPAPTY